MSELIVYPRGNTSAMDIDDWFQDRRNRSSPPKYETPKKRKKERKPVKITRIKLNAAATDRAGDTKTLTKTSRRKRPMAMSTGRIVKKLAKDLKKLKPSLATFMNYVTSTFQPAAAVNKAGYAGFDVVTPATIEALIDKLPVTDPSAVATTNATNMTAVTRNTKWYYNCRVKATLRNNYLFPCEVRWYKVKPKDNTNNGLTTLMSNTQGESIVGAGDYDDPIFYPSSFPQVLQGWKILKSGVQVLNSGEELHIFDNAEGWYNHEYQDEIATTYTVKNTLQYLIRVQGTVAHDTTTSGLIGFSNVKLDGVVKREMKVRYPNIAPLRTLNYTSGLDAITAEMVVDQAEEEKLLE